MLFLRRFQPWLGFPSGPPVAASEPSVEAPEPSVEVPEPSIEASEPSAEAQGPPVKASEPPSTEAQRRGYAPVNYSDNDAFPYVPVGQLGHGGCSFVTKVKHYKTGQVFACKEPLVRPYHRNTQDKLQEEARIIRMLQHRHVIRVVETYMVGSKLRIIMSPVGDIDLKELLLSNINKLYKYQLLLKRVFGCLAYGLAFMYREKVRHKGT